jgi:hypothetical protein
MVDIRNSCYAALLAAFLCPQKYCKTLIFRGAHLEEVRRLHRQDLAEGYPLVVSA